MKKETIKARRKLPQNRGFRLFFGIFAMCAWVFAAVVASQLLVGWPMSRILGAEKFNEPVWTAIYSALSYGLALAITILIPMKLFKKWRVTREDLGLKGLPTWTDIGLGVAGFIAATLIAAGISAIFTLFPWFDAEQAQDVGFNLMVSGGDRIIAFLTLVVLAPIMEEIIFRGWLYGLMRKETSAVLTNIASMILSSLIVSLLFGLVHFQWNVGVNVFALSLILCVLREITGTIYAGILVHVIKNGVAFWLLYVVGMV